MAACKIIDYMAQTATPGLTVCLKNTFLTFLDNNVSHDKAIRHRTHSCPPVCSAAPHSRIPSSPHKQEARWADIEEDGWLQEDGVASENASTRTCSMSGEMTSNDDDSPGRRPSWTSSGDGKEEPSTPKSEGTSTPKSEGQETEHELQRTRLGFKRHGNVWVSDRVRAAMPQRNLTDAFGPIGDAPTTMMIRNVPCSCTKADLMTAFDALGFRLAYDFFYLPMDRRLRSNLGYAFINFVTPEVAAAFQAKVLNHCFTSAKRTATSRKSCVVIPATLQGFDNNLTHYSATEVFRKAFHHCFFIKAGYTQ